MRRDDFIIKLDDLKPVNAELFYGNLAAAVENGQPVQFAYTSISGNEYSQKLGDDNELTLLGNRDINREQITFIQNVNLFLFAERKLKEAKQRYTETQKANPQLEKSSFFRRTPFGLSTLEVAESNYDEALRSYNDALKKLPEPLQDAINNTITSTISTASNETATTSPSVSTASQASVSDERTGDQASSEPVSLSQSFATNTTNESTNNSGPEPELDALNHTDVISAGVPHPMQVETRRATAQPETLTQTPTSPSASASLVEEPSKQPETQTFPVLNPITRFFNAIRNLIYDRWSAWSSSKSEKSVGGKSYSDEPVFDPPEYVKKTTQEAARARTSEFPTSGMSEELDLPAIDLAPIESREKGFFARAIEAMRSLFFSKESPSLSDKEKPGKEMLSARFWLEGAEVRTKWPQLTIPSNTSNTSLVDEVASNNASADKPPAILRNTTSAPQPSISQSNPPNDPHPPAAGPAMQASNIYRPGNGPIAQVQPVPSITPPVASSVGSSVAPRVASSVEVTETLPPASAPTTNMAEKQIALDAAKRLCAADNVSGFKLNIQKKDPHRADATIEDIDYDETNKKTTTRFIATPTAPSAAQQPAKLVLSQTQHQDNSVTKKLESSTPMRLEALFAILAKHTLEEYLVKNNNVLPERGLSINVALAGQSNLGARLSDAEEKLAAAFLKIGFKEVICRGVKRPESMPMSPIVAPTQRPPEVKSLTPSNSPVPRIVSDNLLTTNTSQLYQPGTSAL
jgi:hypothetical protein